MYFVFDFWNCAIIQDICDVTLALRE